MFRNKFEFFSATLQAVNSIETITFNLRKSLYIISGNRVVTDFLRHDICHVVAASRWCHICQHVFSVPNITTFNLGSKKAHGKMPYRVVPTHGRLMVIDIDMPFDLVEMTQKIAITP